MASQAQASTDTPRAFRRPLDGPEQAVIDAALAILERHMRQPGPVCDSPDAVKSYLQLQLAGEPREIFAVAFLDAQHRLIAFEHLTQTLKSALALVDVRVLDHVIVAPGKALSMAEHGLI